MLERLAQSRADGAAPDTEGIRDLLLSEAEVVMRDNDGTLPSCEKTQQVTDLKAIQERLRLSGYVGLTKRTDELVESEREPKSADASCAPERDTKEPTREGVVAWRRSA